MWIRGIQNDFLDNKTYSMDIFHVKTLGEYDFGIHLWISQIPQISSFDALFNDFVSTLYFQNHFSYKDVQWLSEQMECGNLQIGKPAVAL